VPWPFKNVTLNEPQFQGHFLAADDLPGVLNRLRRMAQVGGLSSCRCPNCQGLFVFAGIGWCALSSAGGAGRISCGSAANSYRFKRQRFGNLVEGRGHGWTDNGVVVPETAVSSLVD